MAQTRLTQDKWIAAGLKALRNDGPSALRAEPLARQLKTTKGSFYWHFDDVPAFQSAVLDHWTAAALAGVVAQLETTGTPSDRLLSFGAHVLDDADATAMRAWGQSHDGAADAVAAVDAQRLQYIATLLKALGVTNPGFARAAYGALIGMPLVPGAKRRETDNAYTALIDLVLALR